MIPTDVNSIIYPGEGGVDEAMIHMKPGYRTTRHPVAAHVTSQRAS
jgi:hypothetical protein